MDRGFIGTMDAASTFDDEAYLDFVEGMRVFALTRMAPAMRQQAARTLSTDSSLEPYVDNLPAVQNVLDPMPVVGIRNHLFRNVQEMAWRRAVLTKERDGERLRGELSRADDEGPGRLTLDPALEYPEYYDSMDVHIQPGSYHRYDLAGFVYHQGSNVFHLGENYQDHLQSQIAKTIPGPPDGKVAEVLDIGCTLGRSTCSLKERFPDAHVTGVDISGAVLRYAHRRANRLGVDVDFTQMAAEAMTYEDNSFDLVLSYILFHEVPVEIGRQVIDEVHRILRPGGVFVVVDFPSDNPPATTPEGLVGEYERGFDARLNGEPYSFAMVRSNLNDYLSKTFSSTFIDDQPFEALRGARLRVGQK
ncbi:class I SAM-dependent methyltransferase [Nocardioides sp. W7]|uniref:class I SAM-dependent methyltransferase n=1 Tax=Nocardioides sp. W7 TaxID=2931390 RepID=UPI001FD0C500|nr:class I SAM-dependent methyltransferase [Nocardioides sp. W7]